MHLQPEPLFSLPTDNVGMLDIQGTPEGRIFLGGKDGCLYEVVYQAEDGWFSRKCKKINHSTSMLSFIVPSFLSFSEEGTCTTIKVCYTQSCTWCYGFSRGYTNIQCSGYKYIFMSLVHTVTRRSVGTAFD